MTSFVSRLVALAIEEDLPYGDVTSSLTVSSDLEARAEIFAREDLVICGLDLVRVVFRELKAVCDLNFKFKDGDHVSANQVICEMRGKAATLLAAERTILNFLQKLSGIASHARLATSINSDLTILDTRKTTPGWRELEKYAVRVGGAKNHRFSLSDMILVKDNHIDANRGDLAKTLKKVFADKPSYMPVEVEVRNLDELKTVLEFPLTAIMLDNFNHEQIKLALELLKTKEHNAVIEISGGVDPLNLKNLAELGVKCVSSSSFVTKSFWKDLSLQIYV